MSDTPTPRTDAAEIDMSSDTLTIHTRFVQADFARQLERENQTFRAAQKACEDCDAPRVDRIAELERELEDERALADRLALSLDIALGDWSELYATHETPAYDEAQVTLSVWKEARRDP